MATGEFRIFLSAVTSEFGKARDALAADLRSRGLLVKVQSDFRQEADSDTTLRKLHDYIQDCSAVICIIGTESMQNRGVIRLLLAVPGHHSRAGSRGSA